MAGHPRVKPPQSPHDKNDDLSEHSTNPMAERLPTRPTVRRGYHGDATAISGSDTSFLTRENSRTPVIPSGFLGGSAPCLQLLRLDGVAFPSLPILLPSTSDLVDHYLGNIPQGGYISPEAMAACLAGLAKLQSLFIEFRPFTSFPGQSSTPPVTRALFPALMSFDFQGASEY